MKYEDKEKSKVSRGYAGWFGSWYLRSLAEYKVANYLKYLESKFNITVDYEPGYKTYTVNGRKYKPDFFVYTSGKIRMIIEVKDNKRDATKYLSSFYDYFKGIGIKYRVIYSVSHFLKISRKCKLTDTHVISWKNNSIYDYSGKNSPTFGNIHSVETKRKIGDKTIERCRNKEYVEKLKLAIKSSMTADIRQKISDKAIAHGKIKRSIFEDTNPILEFICDNCQKSYFKRDILDENFNKYSIRSCSKGCTQKLKLSVGIKTKLNKKWENKEKSDRFKCSLISMGNKIYKIYEQITQESIKMAKENGIIYRKAPISIDTIDRYFGNVTQFLKELHETQAY